MHLKKWRSSEKPEEGSEEIYFLREKSIWQQVIKERFCPFSRLPSLYSPGFLYNHLIFSTQGEENVYRTKLRVQKHFPSLECHHLIIETCLIANSFFVSRSSPQTSAQSISQFYRLDRRVAAIFLVCANKMNLVNASNKGILRFPSFQI